MTEQPNTSGLSNLLTFMLENLAKSLNTGGTRFKYLKQVVKEYVIEGSESIQQAVFHIYEDNLGNKYMEADGSIMLVNDEELAELEKEDEDIINGK